MKSCIASLAVSGSQDKWSDFESLKTKEIKSGQFDQFETNFSAVFLAKTSPDTVKMEQVTQQLWNGERQGLCKVHRTCFVLFVLPRQFEIIRIIWVFSSEIDELMSGANWSEEAVHS